MTIMRYWLPIRTISSTSVWLRKKKSERVSPSTAHTAKPTSARNRPFMATASARCCCLAPSARPMRALTPTAVPAASEIIRFCAGNASDTAVSDASLKIGRVTDVLVEVNIGREEAKSGVLEEELEPLLEQISSFSGIRVCGLMTVPPILETEREKRQVFSQMRQLFIDMRGKNIDNVNMSVLSMGMSSDYREAILEGATIIRVGSALFGRRNY